MILAECSKQYDEGEQLRLLVAEEWSAIGHFFHTLPRLCLLSDSHVAQLNKEPFEVALKSLDRRQLAHDVFQSFLGVDARPETTKLDLNSSPGRLWSGVNNKETLE